MYTHLPIREKTPSDLSRVSNKPSCFQFPVLWKSFLCQASPFRPAVSRSLEGSLQCDRDQLAVSNESVLPGRGRAVTSIWCQEGKNEKKKTETPLVTPQNGSHLQPDHRDTCGGRYPCFFRSLSHPSSCICSPETVMWHGTTTQHQTTEYRFHSLG